METTEKLTNYNLIVGKNKTGKTKFLNDIGNAINISDFYLINYNFVKRNLYDELLKKHNVQVVFTQSKYVNTEEIQSKIDKIEEVAKPIVERLSELKQQNFKVDPLLHIHESTYACLMTTMEEKSCIVCDNQHIDLDELLEKYRELGKYIEQQHLNVKNRADYNNLKLQYNDLKSDHRFQSSFLKKIEKDTAENKYQSMFDDFLYEIEKSIHEDLGIKDAKVTIDRENRKITILPNLSRTQRVFLSFILANYFYDNETLIFDDVGLDIDSLKELIKFIHDKKYNNKIYISSLIKPRGRVFQSWNIIEMKEKKELEEHKCEEPLSN